MHRKFDISAGAYSVVAQLQGAGFETYIVGGAIRDLLLKRKPKDFDISTSATPEEVRHVFGRRRARIIGKRFRLTHVTVDGELFEVSTFRRAPQMNAGESGNEKFQRMPENMIVSDNSYGTSTEDAFRRDFTVNALFYDPVNCELIDHTGMGLKDIEDRVVRAIGEPALRFEEDPVRMIRALKLVAQFDFSLDAATENALFASLPFLQHASSGRLSLELEKILKSSSCDRHFEVFFDYGLLALFLPFLASVWGSSMQKTAIDLLYERNCRVDAGIYRDSISLALAAAALPFAEAELGRVDEVLWDKRDEESNDILLRIVRDIFAPQTLMVKVRESAVRILFTQSMLEHAGDAAVSTLIRHKSYAHARELLMIRHLAAGENIAALEMRYPRGRDPRDFRNPERNSRNLRNQDNGGGRSRRRPFRKSGRRPEVKPYFDDRD